MRLVAHWHHGNWVERNLEVTDMWSMLITVICWTNINKKPKTWFWNTYNYVQQSTNWTLAQDKVFSPLQAISAPFATDSIGNQVCKHYQCGAGSAATPYRRQRLHRLSHYMSPLAQSARYRSSRLQTLKLWDICAICSVFAMPRISISAWLDRLQFCSWACQLFLSTSSAFPVLRSGLDVNCDATCIRSANRMGSSVPLVAHCIKNSRGRS
jgi:hypothetical protein